MRTVPKINAEKKRILEVIDKHGGFATKEDFKRSISQYNRSGGASELDRVLNDMLNQMILFEHRHKARNGQEIKFYRSANSNIDTRASPAPSHSDADINLSASINLTNGGQEFIRGLVREAVELFAACINPDKHFAPANADSDDIDSNDDNISPDDGNGFDTAFDEETPYDIEESMFQPLPADDGNLPF